VLACKAGTDDGYEKHGLLGLNAAGRVGVGLSNKGVDVEESRTFHCSACRRGSACCGVDLKRWLWGCMRMRLLLAMSVE